MIKEVAQLKVNVWLLSAEK